MTGLRRSVYESTVLDRPKAVLVALTLILSFFAFHAQDFRLDASADSLLLEDDADLRVYREVRERYSSAELLIVTFTPSQPLFSAEPLARLKSLRDDLQSLPHVDSVVSLLDVPLLKNRDMTLVEAVQNFQILEGPDIDLERARAELQHSPIFRELILSADAKTTALLVNLSDDDQFTKLLKQRDELRMQQRASGLNSEQQALLAQVAARYGLAHAAASERQHAIVQSIRLVMQPYKNDAVMYLGGVAMITDDMISFVRNDLMTFGGGVSLFLVLVLTLIFREVRWVVLPLASCVYAGLIMIGLLGYMSWNVTVISSNFLALMLIITISMNIHLIVRYRQLCRDHTQWSQRALVAETVRKMVRPCFYTALTTIMGFSSLVVSAIKPVIDFGWMMSAGLAVTFVTSFLLFPSLLSLLSRSRLVESAKREFRLPGLLATLSVRHGGAVLGVALFGTALSVMGIGQLRVENSFINYFSEDTEISQGLRLIDRELGGTTPLEIVLHFDAGLDEFEDFFDEDMTEEEREMERLYQEEIADSPEYWFTPDKVDLIKRVHDYVDALPEVGKVLSLASLIRVGEDLNKGDEFDSFALTLLYKRAPDVVKKSMIDPYVSIENNEARLFLRIEDTRADLRRKEFLENLHSGLTNELGLSEEEVTVTGLLVLYNNMLQSLFRSQISTLGVVMLGIAVMFVVLFRSLPLSVIGIVPNLLGAMFVLGLMGWLDIPLDMMTITIAAITIGIAVDNGIHYIYRFREEFAQIGDYEATLRICHANIGKAIFYTTMTIIFGFSILVLSNFIPTIYFGVLTALAMFIALLASLTVLPKLILLWQPFGPGAREAATK
jgi:predicted RND superfamily exporter protein